MILYSILDPIEGPLTALLEWLHTSGGLTWAWSIVALTILVRIVLLPLTVRQIHSMQSMQSHMPEMKALQQRYKNDKQKRNEELMKFYRENNINPAASCLPILFQIPVFISLFFVLRDFKDEVWEQDQAQGETVDDLDWLNLVPDITAAIERIKANGGQILNGPMEVPGGDWIVNAADPQGAAFSLHARRAQ